MSLVLGFAVQCHSYSLNFLCTLMATNFESEITQFLNQFKKQHPDTEASQRQGRARLWDKHIDPELQEGFEEAEVPQPPYVYYQND